MRQHAFDVLKCDHLSGHVQAMIGGDGHHESVWQGFDVVAALLRSGERA